MGEGHEKAMAKPPWKQGRTTKGTGRSQRKAPGGRVAATTGWKMRPHRGTDRVTTGKDRGYQEALVESWDRATMKPRRGQLDAGRSRTKYHKD